MITEQYTYYSSVPDVQTVQKPKTCHIGFRVRPKIMNRLTFLVQVTSIE
jgi:hypothetical protein